MADAKVTYGIIGVIIVSLIGGGVLLLTPEQLDSARTCTTNNLTGIFEKFSSTNVTAYWTENSTQKQLVCIKGKWMPTREWLTLNNLKETDILVKTDLEESLITENDIEIVSSTSITIDKSKQLSINGQVYNITYVEKNATLKCVCRPGDICQLSDCFK